MFKTALATALFTVVGALAPVTVAHADTPNPVPPLPRFQTQDADGYGLALARYLDRYDAGWIDQYSVARMTLFDARGDSVQRKITQMILEGANGDKSLVRFMGPADIRGVAALIHEHPKSTDDSWLYLPASRRVRRISGANRTASFQGTEFTYEDLSSIVVDKYRWRFVRDGKLTADGDAQRVHVVEATPRYRDTGYSKILVHINREHWRVEKMEFFDKAGRALKTLTGSRWKHLHGRYWRAMKLEMSNHQTRKRTVIEIESMFANLALYPKKDGSKRSSLTARQLSRSALEGR